MGKPLLAALLALAALAAQARPGATVSARCEVWQRELSFARTVERHDAAAFAEHVDADAVFDANTAHPLRGRAAILRRWAPIIAGKAVRLRWYPAWVVLAGDPATALSSGPALVEDLTPGASPRYLLLSFSTVWHRGADGAWRVMFDGGSDGHPASAQEVADFEAGRRADCAPELAALALRR
jgi:ketosteroid isomerase-like protein